MIKSLLCTCLAAILILCSCDLSVPSDETESIYFSRGIEPSCMVSEGHFVNNWYAANTNPSCLLIRDYDCFDAYFSIGYIMGMDESKLITDERMEGGFVLSVIYQGYDIPALGLDKIILHNGKLIVYYTRKVRLSDVLFTGNYHLTLLIDDCDFDSVILFENGRRVEHVPVTEVDCN